MLDIPVLMECFFFLKGSLAMNKSIYLQPNNTTMRQ